MRMKNIPLAAIAASLMLTLGLGTSAQAADGANGKEAVNSQAVSATKEISQGDTFKVMFAAWPTKYTAGTLKVDSTMFSLAASDSAKHKGWRMYPTGSSEGGYMVGDNGTKIPLHMNNGFSWSKEGHWWKEDAGNIDQAALYVKAGTFIGAGKYTFTGRVEEYLS
ncbi:MyfA/PsaA family fimbrial adhesin [Yersinia enterocolitica]|uniref:MyfA/PsaA family fimbrial adhesin n=1 Tax=Yersinia enterocolitica TaxID=630 RepID=UPI00289493F9|nr:MyfA/PsaA family fimbrial adhesin [Yersinia enterocolitica]EKN4188375.1 MyfA/PsaA family fimbrial adhesin [Yersinia enterocolitica]EKN4771843.1 MyfA/PsaA family fimbrial adhesin [Yersinia enterocolitica]EKN6022514.1 hypothetical protein [Yersinia enterocolitica]EKN6025908.1 hypothetical protein [Yersinia enterocolitica]